VSFGLAIGSAIEAEHKKEGKIKPLTEEEKKKNSSNSGKSNFINRSFAGLLVFLKAV
jgi:hypothetical protein